MLRRNVLLVAIAAFVLGTFYRGVWEDALASPADDLPLTQLQEMSEIFALIKGNYVEEVPSDRLMESALRGMTKALDPHSSYLSSADLEQFQKDMTSQEYGGLGIHISQKDGWIVVVSPIYDSPAWRAGLRSNDLILKIDGISTQDMNIEDAVSRMRGEKGTTVALDILSQGEGDTPRTIDLVREDIVTPSVVSSVIGDGYGYVRVVHFQDKTVSNLVRNLNGLFEESTVPIRGIILDLRNNPGGLLNSAVGVASVFLPAGITVVSDQGRSESHVLESHSDFEPPLAQPLRLQDIPIVVLVNGGAASASEIVAGALQDHKRAVIVGTRTYGKASVQNIIPLNASGGQTALRLTTARYLTPLGRSIQARGIEPDIVVRPRTRKEKSEEEDFSIRESDLSGHLENTGAQESPEKPQSKRPPFINDDDHQYDQALMVLKAIGLLSAAS